jgi:hypothetical protein
MLAIGNRRLAFTFLVGGLLILGSAHKAIAEVGFLPPDSMACTDQVRSDHGASVYGHADSREVVTWTVLMSSTAEGEATEVFRADRNILDTTNITPPTEGIFFFRACVSNNTSASARYAFWIVQQAGSIEYTLDVGWHTALLSPLGIACGGFGADQDLRVGDSDAPVLWTVQTFDGDMNFIVETAGFTGTSVNDVITLTAPAFYFAICATNTSEITATLLFDVL